MESKRDQAQAAEVVQIKKTLNAGRSKLGEYLLPC